MYKFLAILFVLISFSLAAQEIPDYKGDYVFTNSRLSMEGIRELITHQEEGKRTIQFNAKFPLGRIKIISDFTESNNLMTSTKYYVDARWTLISDKRTLNFDQASGTLTSKGKSIINRIYHLDRGYEKIEKKLQKVGVKIKRLT